MAVCPSRHTGLINNNNSRMETVVRTIYLLLVSFHDATVDIAVKTI